MPNRTTIALTAALALATAAVAGPNDFADGFEGTQIDSFWTVYQTRGTAAPSAELPHSGFKSLRLETIDSTEAMGVQLSHDFGRTVYGRVSISVYDSGADVWSSNYLMIWLTDSVGGKSASIGVTDYDLGHGNNGSEYNAGTWGSWGAMVETGIDRTKVWHTWEIESLPGSMTVRIDGHAVYSGTDGRSFDSISFSMWGPGFRPGFVSFWDDFEFVEYTPPCLADFNADGVLNIFDFLAFQAAFGNGC